MKSSPVQPKKYHKSTEQTGLQCIELHVQFGFGAPASDAQQPDQSSVIYQVLRRCDDGNFGHHDRPFDFENSLPCVDMARAPTATGSDCQCVLRRVIFMLSIPCYCMVFKFCYCLNIMVIIYKTAVACYRQQNQISGCLLPHRVITRSISMGTRSEAGLRAFVLLAGVIETSPREALIYS